ncbi:MAG: polar amino acid transport system substrate-binding protein [Chthoniobacter sp.]|jgi:polar amino acid transport system substrate-binding protein|nr:polar amino acid transport system substrate-binding protein [Chthoniobacter sp.]
MGGLKPHRFAAFLLLAAGLLLAGCKKPLSNELIVGMELAYPPFEMTDAQGKPAGVSVDLAHALGEYLHRPVRIENLPFDGLIPSLKTGKIDLILSSMTATEERARTIAFSEPYLRTGLCLLVGKGSEIQSISEVDRPGRTIVVKQGTTGHTYAAAHLKAPQVRVLDQENSCVLEVVQGKADAFIYDQISTFKHWQKNQETTRAILQPFQEEAWAIGVRKENDELRGQFNAFIRDYRTRGGFEELGDRWLKEQKTAFRERGIPFLF